MDVFLAPLPGVGKPFRSLDFMKGDSMVVSKFMDAQDHLTYTSVNMKKMGPQFPGPKCRPEEPLGPLGH